MRTTDLLEMLRLPRIAINLMEEKTADNDPFFARAARRYYDAAMARRPRSLYLIRTHEYGYAVCLMPQTFQAYWDALDPAARQNYRRAERHGFTFRRFDYNTQLDAIRAIWLSTPVRQGLMPQQQREGRVLPISDPPSRTSYHDYAYFGVFKDQSLVAYAGCLIAGELCSLNDLYGHAAYYNDCVVPMAIVEVARALIANYPTVRYYAYDNYFGASDSLRRFKRKFNFLPHHARWLLRTPGVVLPSIPKRRHEDPLNALNT